MNIHDKIESSIKFMDDDVFNKLVDDNPELVDEKTGYLWSDIKSSRLNMADKLGVSFYSVSPNSIRGWLVMNLGFGNYYNGNENDPIPTFEI